MLGSSSFGSLAFGGGTVSIASYTYTWGVTVNGSVGFTIGSFMEVVGPALMVKGNLGTTIGATGTVPCGSKTLGIVDGIIVSIT